MEKKSNRNRLAGIVYEEEIVDKINAIQALPKVGRTADLNKLLDEKKVDIVTVDENLFEEFELKIQAKTNTKHVPYIKLLDELETHSPGGMPVILHKKTQATENGERFLTKGTYAILKEEDFIKLVGDLAKFKKGYYEFNNYFDSVHPTQQQGLNERLDKLGL